MLTTCLTNMLCSGPASQGAYEIAKVSALGELHSKLAVAERGRVGVEEQRRKLA